MALFNNHQNTVHKGVTFLLHSLGSTTLKAFCTCSACSLEDFLWKFYGFEIWISNTPTSFNYYPSKCFSESFNPLFLLSFSFPILKPSQEYKLSPPYTSFPHGRQAFSLPHSHTSFNFLLLFLQLRSHPFFPFFSLIFFFFLALILQNPSCPSIFVFPFHSTKHSSSPSLFSSY